MKLNWRETSDGERWFANVPEGQIFVDRSTIKGVAWFIEWLYLDPDWRGSLCFFSTGKRFANADDAMAEVERWYFSQVKANQCES